MKKLMRNGRRGKVIRMDKRDRKKVLIDIETLPQALDPYLKAMQLMQGYGGTITKDPYCMGPFTIKMITVMRQRQGKEVEVDQRWLVDGYGRPIVHGTRKQLDRKLRQYEMGYLKFLMTRGTKAEGV